MTIFRLLIALAIVIYILSAIYSAWVGVFFGLIIFCVLLFGFSKRVQKRMRRIENRFLDNLNERELRRSGRKNNVVANLHMAFMTVGYDCPFVGERLQDSGLRANYGVSIASIQRAGELIPVPSGDTRIFPGDVLGVIATDEQIQALLPVVEASSDHTAQSLKPSDFKLTTVQLSESSPIIGRTVSDTQLGKLYKALLVSIDRDGEFITPGPYTTFFPHDVLWIVGNPATLAQLK